MPTYDYACPACGARFEVLQSIKDKPLSKCEKCGKKGVKRLIGAGAGLIFKGSGFYITDYRGKDYGEAAKKDAPASDAKPAEAKGGESKAPDAKPEKPAAAAPKPGSKGEKKSAKKKD